MEGKEVASGRIGGPTGHSHTPSDLAGAACKVQAVGRSPGQGIVCNVATAILLLTFSKLSPFRASCPPSSPPPQTLAVFLDCVVLTSNRLFPFLQLCPLLGLRRSSRPGRTRRCRPRRRTRSDLSEPVLPLPRSLRLSVRAQSLVSSRAMFDLCSNARAENVFLWLSFRPVARRSYAEAFSRDKPHFNIGTIGVRPLLLLCRRRLARGPAVSSQFV